MSKALHETLKKLKPRLNPQVGDFLWFFYARRTGISVQSAGASFYNQLKQITKYAIIFEAIVFLLMFCVLARASTMPTLPLKNQRLATNAFKVRYYTDNEIADAIFKAEGIHSSHPYGILIKYKTTTPRQACINTIKSARKRFVGQNKEKDFIHFLSLTYAPINCNNDNGTNQYWEKNVKYFLDKHK